MNTRKILIALALVSMIVSAGVTHAAYLVSCNANSLTGTDHMNYNGTTKIFHFDRTMSCTDLGGANCQWCFKTWVVNDSTGAIFPAMNITTITSACGGGTAQMDMDLSASQPAHTRLT